MKPTPKKKAKKARPYAAGRQAFLTIRDELAAHLEGGGTLAAFFRDNEKSLAGMSYSQFARYAKRYISGPEQENVSDEHSDSDNTPGTRQPAATPPRPPGPKRFERPDDIEI